MEYVSIEEGKKLPGLRLVLTQGLPGSWGVGARALFEIKGLDYVAVAQEAFGTNDALQAWTGQSSAPVAVYNDERPRILWSEQLLLAERLAPEPRLIPTDEDERTLMFGISHEICAEDGLGWNLRNIIFANMESAGVNLGEFVTRKYSSAASLDHAKKRSNEIIAMLARRLAAQAAKGSGYFVGNALSAADVYWAAFSNLVVPLPDDAGPMPESFIQMAPACAAHLAGPIPAILVEQRDRILRKHYKLPILL